MKFMIFPFIFLCIFHNFLSKYITLMGCVAKNLCFGGKLTSEQALVPPLTTLIWGLLSFYEPQFFVLLFLLLFLYER